MIHQQGLSILFLMITYSILQRIEIDNLKHIVLGHLSKENNYDKLAYETVKLEIDLSDNEYKSKDFHIEVAKRSEPSTLLEI